MGAIRRQQISEVLNYDRNMNLKVLAMERKQAVSYTHLTLPTNREV